MTRSHRFLVRGVAALAAAGLLAGGLTACTTATTASTSSTTTAISAASVEADSLWDSSAVHDISIEVDASELTAALTTYLDTGEKVWITATVTIDGVVYENVGLKLKGNSSLRAVSADSDPATLPWLIRLDQFVEGQNVQGETELVVRGNTTETALNEAVALELLGQAGLATEEAIASRFTVNGGTSQLRLVIQNPGDEWDAATFGTEGALYKAEAGGSYDYLGTDPASYVDVFEQEAGEDDLTPLTDFLQFINESDDATFAADLDQYLDIDAFATYLAYQELVDNFDDIDGPGNNSYLRYDATTGLMTVVNWDLNLAFGTQNVGGGAGGAGQPGNGGAPPAGGQGQAGGPSSGNILSERFLANDAFAALVTSATAELTASLFDSGLAQEDLDAWVSVLTAQAGDLVDATTVQEEAAAVARYF